MKKILIVDDSSFMRNVLKDMIIGNGKGPSLSEKLQIFEADGKKNALAIAKKEHPNVILLDIVMKESEMEGVEFIVAANEFFDLSKIIMITSIGHMEIIDTCKNLGVKFYLQKPFEQSEVINSISQVINS